MKSRQIQVKETIDALYTSNTPIVGVNDQGYYASGGSDNIGIYYFVPLLAKVFNLSPHDATNLFFLILVSIGSLIATISFTYLLKGWITRLFSTALIGAFGYFVYLLSDIYIANYFAIASTVPLFLLIKERYPHSKLLFAASIIWSGLVVGYANMIRQYSGTTALLFLVLWIPSHSALNKATKWINICLLVACTFIGTIHEKSLKERRNIFLGQFHPSGVYEDRPFPTWHLFYLGLGYLPNDFGIYMSDSSSFEKARSINPDIVYTTKEYNDILKKEYFMILKKAPFFVFKTYFSKFTIIILKLMKYSLIGLILYWYARPSWKTLAPFLGAGSFGILPGIVTRPLGFYFLGALSLSFILSLYILYLAIVKYQSKRASQLQVV